MKNIISGDDDGIIIIWNFNSGKAIKTLLEHTNVIKCIAINENDK